MKNAMLILAGVLAIGAMEAQAAVVDQFSCLVSFDDKLGNKVLESKLDLNAVREELVQPLASDLKLTQSEVKASTSVQNGKLQLHLVLSYNHALKLDQKGRVIQAAQKTCEKVVLCLSGVAGQTCQSSACAEGENPFDEVQGWPQVRVSRDGIPAFDSQALKKIEIPTLAGTFLATCKLTGTRK